MKLPKLKKKNGTKRPRMTKEEKAKKLHKMKLVNAIGLVGFAPLIVMSVILCSLAVVKMTKSLEDSAMGKIKIVADSALNYYELEMQVNSTVPYAHDFVDKLKDDGIEMSVYVDKDNFLSSIESEDGKRIEGTKIDEEAYETLSKGEEYSSTSVEIEGEEYYGYYLPILKAGSTYVGAVFAGVPASHVKDEVNRATKALIITSIVLVLITIVILVYVCIIIKKPIVAIVENVNQMAKGELTSEITAKSGLKEVAVLISAAKQFQENLQKIISEVNNNAVSMDDNMDSVSFGVNTCTRASEGIVSAVDELAKGTMDMAESVQNCTESMNMIGNEISDINELTQMANDSANEATVVSNAAKAELEKLLVANQQTITVSANVVDGINMANEAAKKIKAAAEVITEIASETSLLALNASIEAARAGEAGAGFAVVASSIQNLSAQSDESAKEIQDVIANIISISNKNVSLANDIRKAVNNEGNVLAEVNESFNVVNSKITITADAVSSISDKANKLDKEKNDVLDEVSTLSAISEENAASCQETNASMEELRANIETINQQASDTKGVSGQLAEAVAYFKL